MQSGCGSAKVWGKKALAKAQKQNYTEQFECIVILNSDFVFSDILLRIRNWL
jgi:hypothetical protein